MSLDKDVEKYLAGQSGLLTDEAKSNKDSDGSDGSDNSDVDKDGIFLNLVSDKDLMSSFASKSLADESTGSAAFGGLCNSTQMNLEILNTFSERDKDNYKTFSRKLVEKYLSKQKWYYDPDNLYNAPSLKQAWAFYEHVVLARYLEEEGEHKFSMAEPGENNYATKLYSPLQTPSSALGEWGIGVALYFSTVWKISILLLIAGLISLANAVYYGGSDYDGQYDSRYFVLRGSAVCLRTEWVSCPNCEKKDWEDHTEAYAVTDQSQVFVQHNLCEGAQISQAMVTFGSLAFLIIFFWLLDWYQQKVEVKYDENWITASDYSVWVRNPPPDANDPEEWRAFFEQFSDKQVTCCTIALNNQDLVKALARTRVLKYDLLDLLKDKTINLDNEPEAREAVAKYREQRKHRKRSCGERCFKCLILPLLRLLKISPKTPELMLDELKALREEIKKLEVKDYDVISVFVTFETEKGKNTALESLSISEIDLYRNQTDTLASTSLFRGKHILSVCEAPEPNTVRWMELDCKTIRTVIERLITFAITFGLAVVAGFAVREVRNDLGPFASAIVLSISNFLIPNAVYIMLEFFETHPTDDSYQQSLYLKVALFRWVSTVLLTFLISKQVTALRNEKIDLLMTVSFVFVSELFVSPVLKVLDLGGMFKKHFLAPRAETQQRMNYAMRGTDYNIGERYTDLTKILSLSVFYSTLMPTSLIFGSIILFVQYASDKFCLMRVWSRAPFVGPKIAQFSRRYFFNFAILTSVFMATYIYASFPFDNLCVKNEQSSAVQTGKFTVTLLDNRSVDIMVSNKKEYTFCNQANKILEHLPNPWFKNAQPVDSKWMTESQESTVNFFGLFSWIYLGSVFLSVIFPLLFNYFQKLFTSTYEADTADQMLDFTNMIGGGLSAYIPQIKVEKFTFPLLACDIDDIDMDLIGWNPHPMTYDYYNLLGECFEEKKNRDMGMSESLRRKRGSTIAKTLSELAEKTEKNHQSEEKEHLRKVFSVVKNWQPDWLKQEAGN